MSFDQDPGEQARISASDFEQMCDEMKRLREQNEERVAALVAISTNPHINLGDLVYAVRDAEGLGWEGPAVAAWGEACEAVKAAISTGKEAQ